MKRIMIGSLSLFILSSPAFAKHCKTGDLNACAAVLTKMHRAKVTPTKFVQTFDQVCAENAKFRCVKRTVRGDVAEEMKLTKQENPKAHLYEVRVQAEDFIYILENK